MSCDHERCLTCSDEALPLRVVALTSAATAACADEAGAVSEVMVDLVGPVTVGDTLLVHAGTALARLGLEDGR